MRRSCIFTFAFGLGSADLLAPDPVNTGTRFDQVLTARVSTGPAVAVRKGRDNPSSPGPREHGGPKELIRISFAQDLSNVLGVVFVINGDMHRVIDNGESRLENCALYCGETTKNGIFCL